MIRFEVILVLLLGVILDNNTYFTISLQRRKKIYIFTCLAVFWMVAALRNTSWVASLHLDAEGYAYTFRMDRLLSWAALLDQVKMRYLYRVGEADIGYSILNKMVGYITGDYNIFSLITDALFFIPFGLLTYRYTNRVRQIIFAFIFYIALLQTHMLSGARQMFAIGVCILAVLSAVDNNKRQAILLLLAGMTIHFSALLMLLPLLLIFFDIKPKMLKNLHILSLIAFPFIFMLPNQVIGILANISGLDRYAYYAAGEVQGGTNTFICLLLVLSIFCLYALSTEFLSENAAVRKLYTMAPFFTLFGPLIRSNGSMIRICMYFYIFLVILIPQGMDRKFVKKNNPLAYVIVCGALILLIFRSGIMDYHFMWQAF